MWVTNATRHKIQDQWELRNESNFYIQFSRLSSTDLHPLIYFPRCWNEFLAIEIKTIANINVFNNTLAKFILDELDSDYKCPRLLCPPLSSMMVILFKICIHGKDLMLSLGVPCSLLKVVVSLGCTVHLPCLGPRPLITTYPAVTCQSAVLVWLLYSLLFLHVALLRLKRCALWYFIKTAMLFHAPADVLHKQCFLIMYCFTYMFNVQFVANIIFLFIFCRQLCK